MRPLSVRALSQLAGRQLWRDLRTGDLRVLFFSLLIAVTASSAIGYFGERLKGAMQARATEFLGADLVLRGSAPLSAEQQQVAQQSGLTQAQVVEFSSMVATDNGLELASVKAADQAYPLRGSLRSAAQPLAPEETGVGPAPGEVWAEARLLLSLNLNIGQTLEIGNAAFTLTRVLTHEPDRAADFYSLTPRVLMNLDDLAATQVVQPGSRVRYLALYSGSSEAIDGFKRAIEPLLQTHQRVINAKDSNRQIGGALGRAERYLNLASLAAVLLCSVAVALSAHRFAVRHFDTGALLRCLGLSRRQTLQVFAWQLGILGLAACVAGALLGFAAQSVLFLLLAGLLPPYIPAPGLWPALGGMATGMLALAGFALPPLAALGRVPPLRVLRRDLLPVPVASWLIYSAALAALGLIMWRLSLDLKLTLALLGGGLLACALLGALLLLGLNVLRRLLRQANLAWRLGLGQLLRHPLAAAGQSMAFGLILLAMALIALLRTELLDTWQAQLPAQAPNHFAMNIQPHEQQAFSQALDRIAPQHAALYPIVAGRLTHINGTAVRQAVTKEGAQQDNALRRDLSLTWSDALPSGNQIVAGNWWDNTSSDSQVGVSVESELAQRLKLKLGDQLTFTVAGSEYQAQIRSLRTVKWDSFQPNFYMIFEPGTLQDVPTTYLTSFYLPEKQEQQLIDLARQFPTVTLLPVEALLKQLRSILAQVTLAVEYVLLFVLAAGFCVLFAGLQSTLAERIQQGALLRALGAKRGLLLAARRTEFGLLGAASGLLAAAGCELISFLLYRYVFELSWQPHPWLLLLPLIGALLISGAGIMGTRRALTASPLDVLRDHS